MTVRLGPAARRDLADHVDWLRQEAGADTAERFVSAAIESLRRIDETPGLGAVVDTKRAELVGARKWRIQGFPRLLIFYQPEEDGIRVLRVLHAAKDWR